MKVCGKLTASKVWLVWPFFPSAPMAVFEIYGVASEGGRSAILLHEKCHAMCLAVFHQFDRPFQFEGVHVPSGAGFASNDHPVDSFEV